MRESPLDTPVNPSASRRMMAAAIVFAGCCLASSVIITLIGSIFMAFVLAPGVALAERMKLPKGRRIQIGPTYRFGAGNGTNPGPAAYRRGGGAAVLQDR